MIDVASKEKFDALAQMLERGLVIVHLDARVPGVDVPPKYKGNPQLKLNLSYKFDRPNIALTDSGVSAVLSFQGARYACELPWKSIYSAGTSGSGFIWIEDAPEEVRAALIKHLEPEQKAPKKNHLRLVN